MGVSSAPVCNLIEIQNTTYKYKTENTNTNTIVIIFALECAMVTSVIVDRKEWSLITKGSRGKPHAAHCNGRWLMAPVWIPFGEGWASSIHWTLWIPSVDPTLWTLIELFEFHPDESLELSQLNPDGSMDLFGNYSQRQLLCDRYNYWYLGDNHYIMWNGRFPENTCDDNGKTVSLEAEISTQRCTPFSYIPCELASLRKYFFLFVLFHNMAQSGLQSVHFKLKLFSISTISSQSSEKRWTGAPSVIELWSKFPNARLK